MSSSCTSSDDEFESADEGEQEVNADTTPSFQNEEIAGSSELSSLSQPEETLIEHCGACKEETVSVSLRGTANQSLAAERKEAHSPDVESLEDKVNNLDLTDYCIGSEPITTNKLEENEFRENSFSCIVAQNIDDSSSLDFKVLTRQGTQDPVAAISRNVGRAPNRAKPSLGAKRLGAVKLPEASVTPIQSEITTFAKGNANEPTEDVPRSSASLAKSSSRPAPSEPDESNTWGWFAPPKSILSSVTLLTTQILSTVENGLNIPEPEDLAKEDLDLDETSEQFETKEPGKTGPPENKGLGFGLFGGVTNLTRLVETTSTSLFATGLDTLESIGKKTIDVLQQTDPGFKKTRAALVKPLAGTSQEKICLSQILREAKDSNDSKSSELIPPNLGISSTPSLASLIELHYGATHFEALQVLSQQWNTRVTTQIRRLTTQRRIIFDEISQICSGTAEAEDDDCDPDEFNPQHFEENVNSLLDRVSLIVPSDKLFNAIREGMLDDDEVPGNLYASALDSLALVTSRSIELLRKSAELLLMMPKPSNPVAEAKLEAGSLCQIASLLTNEITRLGNRHAALLIKSEKSKDDHSTTDFFYECSNCRSMIQDAFKLMIPILQSRVI